MGQDDIRRILTAYKALTTRQMQKLLPSLGINSIRHNLKVMKRWGELELVRIKIRRPEKGSHIEYVYTLKGQT